MNNQSTKSRILEVASRNFCAKGFKRATIREICAEADANVASVNYHFGDKRKLYVRVLSLWLYEMIKNSGLMDEHFHDLPLEVRMKSYVRSELLSLCTFDDPEKNRKKQIRLLLEEYVSEDCDPQLFKHHEEIEEKVLFKLIRDILHPIEDKDVLEQACISTSGILTNHFLMIIHYPEGEIESKEKLEFMIDFYTTYILGSLKAIKEKYLER